MGHLSVVRHLFVVELLRPEVRTVRALTPGRPRPGSAHLGSAHLGSAHLGSAHLGSTCGRSARAASRAQSYASPGNGRNTPSWERDGNLSPKLKNECLPPRTCDVIPFW